MIEFEEYKGKLNGLKPTLDSLREALHLEAAEKRSRSLRDRVRATDSGTTLKILSACRSV